MSTLIETIVVLVLLGILAAVAVPRYLDMTEAARAKVAVGQIGMVKGRLVSALNSYLLANHGNQPTDGNELITYANTIVPDTCPTADTTEGDFVFKCAMGTGQEVLIIISAVQGKTLTPAVSGSLAF
jgi:type II secretory pathway pseudopilin PulG